MIDPSNSSSLAGHAAGRAVELAAVAFADSKPDAGKTETATFSDASNPPVATDIGNNVAISAKLSGLTDETTKSLLSTADPNGSGTTATGNAVSLDNDSSLNPTISVNAANPADVIFTVSGLESDYSGTVTFTDSTGKSDVAPIGGNGTYTANLSNLANGTLTYLMTVSDPAGNVINVDPTVTLGDGSVNAPAGPAQLPNLLSGYVARPPWMVAGVDYAVGVPSGTSLTPWYSLSGSGISVNTSTHVVSVYNTSGVNITGVDFSLNGGAILMFVNSPNGVVSHCNFGGANLTSISNGVIAADQGSGGLTVEYCTINGGGAGSGSTLISAGGSGTVTLEYNLFENFPQHVLELTQGSGTSFSVVYKYNLIEQGAEQPSAHLNYLQFSSGTATSVNVKFNTSYQTPQAGGAGEGYQFYDNSSGGSISNVTLAYNTMIATGGAQGTAMSYLIHGGTGSWSASNNYIADPAAWGAFYSGSFGGWSISNNVDMVTGNFIETNNSEVARTTVTQVAASPSSGIESSGNTVKLTVHLSKAVTVSGTPTLTLNDGGTATYTGGSGTSALTFKHTVSSTDSSVAALAITQVNLPNGATITDGSGKTPNLSGAVTTFPNLQIDPPSGPTLSSIVETPSSSDLNAGKTVTLTLNFSEVVSVAGGRPTLTLNDGGIATYTSGSGSKALTFTYKVAAGQNTSDLAATAVNLNGATITHSGATANLSLTGLTQTGPQIDTTAPAPPVIANHTVNTNNTVTLTGTTEANSIVRVYDNGSTLLGKTTASASGAWTYTTPKLPNGTNVFTATATDAAGNKSGLSNAMDPVIGPNNISSLTVNNGAIVDLSRSSAAAVTFAGSSGMLQLDHPAGFSGTISGFAGRDQIDLTSVAFSSNTTLGYLPNAGNLGGTLSVSDGVHNVSLALLGQYIASSFVTASDGHGGTLVSEQSSNPTISLAHPHAPA